MGHFQIERRVGTIRNAFPPVESLLGFKSDTMIEITGGALVWTGPRYYKLYAKARSCGGRRRFGVGEKGVEGREEWRGDHKTSSND